MRALWIAAVLLAASMPPAWAQKRAARPETIEAVTLNRLHNEYYSCSEHFDGELEALGDALASDCLILGGQLGGEGFLRPFGGDGARNEDWYGWNAEVLAPFDGIVSAVSINPVTNQPGRLGQPPASRIEFRRADGLIVVLAHVQGVRVAEGDAVRAGQVVAHVGNNGYSRGPHTHVGAYRGDTPYQIRWDLRSGVTRRP